jgi:hypothetical protein
MRKIDERVRRMIAEVEKKHRCKTHGRNDPDRQNGIARAHEEAKARFWKMKGHEEWVADLVDLALLDLIYERSHHENVARRRAARYYGKGPRVKPGRKVTEKVYRSVYEHRVAGMILGNISGEELPGLIDLERSQVRGHGALLRLYIWLVEVGRVKPGKLVREVVPERKLRAAYARYEQDLGRDGAPVPEMSSAAQKTRGR